MPNYNSSEWIHQIFEAKQVQRGGIIRRSVKSVRRYASEAQLGAAVQALGFHMVQSGKQFVIFCNPGEFQLVV
jgi:hypothetical protein